jgi:hypothetical protein
VVIVPLITPREVPSDVAKLSTTAVPPINPVIDAELKQYAFVEVMLPPRFAVLDPVLAPWVMVPAKL